jgi:3'-phosphoadenosine 5'-phosphosulfate sulfotransferase (PAPS reductase)/FAD synthetase
MIILWFSCGAASAVACKLALAKRPDARIVYQHIESAHADNKRFIADCEKWYGRSIEIISSPFYRDQFDVVKATRYINGPSGARCTTELKKKVRKYFQAQNPTIELQVFGMSAEEKHRAERLLSDGNNYAFPLIDANYTKADCYQILGAERIELPVMYKLGFNNNNCIGCVKGGKGYWNMIKKHFPDYFNKMAALEREIGRSCIKNKFLDELLPTEGDHKEPDIECGLFCNAGVWQ